LDGELILKKVLAVQNTLAQSEAQSPEWKKIGFLGPKERPKEAPFGTQKTSFLIEDLERKAGNGSW